MKRLLTIRMKSPITCALTLIACAAPAVATDFTVDNLGDSGAGSLRQAVLDANAQAGADSIHFDSGLVGTIVLTTGELSITDSLVIEGPGAEGLFISGNQQSRIFRISGGATVTIAGLTITSGKAKEPFDGGGILNTGGTLTLDRVVLANNQAVSAVPGVPGRGGAVANISGANLIVTDCLITENRAVGGPQGVGSGGAILNQSSRLTVSNSRFIGNEAIGGTGGGQGLGAGITNMAGAEATINDSVFIDNRALAGSGSTTIGVARGGAIYNFQQSALTVVNSRIEGNVSRGGSNIAGSGPLVGVAFGGGIHSAGGGPLILAGCIVRGNQAIGGDGNSSSSAKAFVGAAFGGGLNCPSTANVTDCLFEDNEAHGGSGNMGSTVGFQFVGTGIGGGINVLSADASGVPASFSVFGVTLRANRALGGSGNTPGKIANAGIGGGLGSNGSNVMQLVSPGCITTMQDCTIEHNLAIGGSGGQGLGGGIANILGGFVQVSGGALMKNRAQGGDGGPGMGGGIYNGPASNHPSNPGAPTVLKVEGADVAFNKAQGGFGATAGHAAGGGLWNGSDASISDTEISWNMALGADGTDAGDGFGGGAYNASSAHLVFERCTVTENRANGGEASEGGTEGQGIGGGVYTLGLFEFETFTVIGQNSSSTSHDDIFQVVP